MKIPMNINERDLQSDWIDAILYDYNIVHGTSVLSAEWTYNTNTVRFTSKGRARVHIMQDLHNQLLQMFEPSDTFLAEITKINDHTLIIRFYYDEEI